jgi:radical SAM protein with 4Fe4S-binding SPASM domain
MKLFTSNKILSYYDNIQKIVVGELPFPRMALIYPSYTCNYKCPHCLYTGWNTGKFMPKDKMLKLVDELADAGVKAIEFCGGGEPTLHPDFIDIVRHIRNHGIEIGVLTNGSTLGKLYYILADNFSYVRISLDSVNACQYKKAHGLPTTFNFDKFLSNIENFIYYKNSHNQKCVIGLKFLLTKEHINISDAVEFSRRVKADYVQFKTARACSQEPSDTQLLVYKHEIQKFNDPMILDGSDRTSIKCQCYLTPIHTMIDAKGDVYLCCYYQHRKKTHKFGNVFKNSFRDVWQSDRHREAIAEIKIDECNVWDCRFHKYNQIMNGVLKENDYHINFI